MEFIATVWKRNVFGCYCDEEDHAYANSTEAAKQFFDAGMNIFKNDVAFTNSLKVNFSDGVCVCIYRESEDIDNGVYSVREWKTLHGYDESTKSRAALKKMMLSKFAAEFSEPAEQSAQA